MHIRFNRPLRGDYGRAKTGDVKMVTKEVGKSLIARGLAEEVDAAADAPDAPDSDTEQTEAKGRKAAK